MGALGMVVLLLAVGSVTACSDDEALDYFLEALEDNAETEDYAKDSIRFPYHGIKHAEAFADTIQWYFDDKGGGKQPSTNVVPDLLRLAALYHARGATRGVTRGVTSATGGDKSLGFLRAQVSAIELLKAIDASFRELRFPGSCSSHFHPKYLMQMLMLIMSTAVAEDVYQDDLHLPTNEGELAKLAFEQSREVLKQFLRTDQPLDKMWTDENVEFGKYCKEVKTATAPDVLAALTAKEDAWLAADDRALIVSMLKLKFAKHYRPGSLCWEANLLQELLTPPAVETQSLAVTTSEASEASDASDAPKVEAAAAAEAARRARNGRSIQAFFASQAAFIAAANKHFLIGWHDPESDLTSKVYNGKESKLHYELNVKQAAEFARCLPNLREGELTMDHITLLLRSPLDAGHPCQELVSEETANPLCLWDETYKVLLPVEAKVAEVSVLEPLRLSFKDHKGFKPFPASQHWSEMMRGPNGWRDIVIADVPTKTEGQHKVITLKMVDDAGYQASYQAEVETETDKVKKEEEKKSNPVILKLRFHMARSFFQYADPEGNPTDHLSCEIANLADYPHGRPVDIDMDTLMELSVRLCHKMQFRFIRLVDLSFFKCHDESVGHAHMHTRHIYPVKHGFTYYMQYFFYPCGWTGSSKSRLEQNERFCSALERLNSLTVGDIKVPACEKRFPDAGKFADKLCKPTSAAASEASSDKSTGQGSSLTSLKGAPSLVPKSQQSHAETPVRIADCIEPPEATCSVRVTLYRNLLVGVPFPENVKGSACPITTLQNIINNETDYCLALHEDGSYMDRFTCPHLSDEVETA